MPVLTTNQPVVGVDIHDAMPPIAPLPMPHPVVWGLGLSLWMGIPLSASCSKANTPALTKGRAIMARGGHVLGRGHDAGPHPGHLYPNALLPLIMIGSASKAEFACGTVHTPQGKLAINCLRVCNLQLHCADPMALPSGMSVAMDHSVRAGFTVADLLNGLVHTIVDTVIDLALGVAAGAAGRLATNAGSILRGASLAPVFQAFGSSADDVARGLKRMPAIPFADAVSGRRWIQQMDHLWNTLRFATSPVIADHAIPEIAHGFAKSMFGVGVGKPLGGASDGNAHERATNDDGALPLNKTIDALFYP